MSPRRVVAPDAGHRDAAGVASDLVVVGTKVDQLAAVPDTFAADRASKDNPVRRERQGVITIIVVDDSFSFEDLHVQDLPAVPMIRDVERTGATGGEVDLPVISQTPDTVGRAIAVSQSGQGGRVIPVRSVINR